MNKDLETVLFDIDGVLADNKDYKNWFDHNGMFNQTKFGKDIPSIPVLDWGRSLAHALNKNYNIVLVTARAGMFREKTISWLNNRNIPYDRLHTNDENVDFDKVSQYKLDIAEQYNVMMTIEDSPSMVNAYRENGYICLQPNHLYGDK